MVQEGETALHRTADGARGCGSVGNRKKAALALIEHGGTALLLEANEVILEICQLRISVVDYMFQSRASALDASLDILFTSILVQSQPSV